MYLAHSMPHVPLAASEKFRGKSNAGLYGDVMLEMDWSVGEVLKTLSKEGVESNTLIIFTSDNGPWRSFGNHAGSSGGFREAKTTVFEGGQRVPCLMKWPGKIPKGLVCNKLSSSIDILPTLAAICHLNLPKNKIDGVNISDLLIGKAEISPRRYFYYYYDKNSLKAVRRDDWKLVLPHKSTTYEKNLPGMNGQRGEISFITVPLALYDLRQDPSERYDVQISYPEIVEELKKVAEQARKDLGDDLTERKGNYRREPGKVE